MRNYAIHGAILILALLIIGCSSGSGSPILPPENNQLTDSVPVTRNTSSTQTHLWGYYDITLDTETGTVEAVCNRSLMFTANVTNFINSNPLAMSFDIVEIIPGDGYLDVDINVGLTHPFPGYPQYDGYDVRGVFMGDGSVPLTVNGLEYADSNTDQFVMEDPDNGPGDPAGGGPDGYTRWFNPTEFTGAGMPLFNYTPGKFATPDYNGSATLCPYKYYADSLGTNKDLYDWLSDNTDKYGVFSSGATNERNYYIRFPDAVGVTFGYAVIANWENVDVHPSNAVESIACDVVDNSNVYYIDGSNNGGQLDLEISLFDWHSALSAGVMEDYNIWIESTVTSSPYELDDTEMTPVASNGQFNTYAVTLDADSVTGINDNHYWVIVEYPGYDYSNDFEIPNLADDEVLMAFFRYDLDVSGDPQNLDPVCDLQVVEGSLDGWDATGAYVELDASGSYDPDGDPLTFSWDFDADGIYDEPDDDENLGTDENPIHNYMEDGVAWLKLEDGNGGSTECSIDITLNLYPSKNIPLKSGSEAYDIAADPVDGDLLMLFASGEIYKREIDEWYQDDTDVFFGDLGEDIMQDPTGLRFMDITGDEAVVICGVSDNEGFNRMAYYKPDGTPHSCGIFIGSSSNLLDAWAFGTDAGPHTNYAGDLRGRDADYNNNHYMELEWFVPPDYCGGAHFASYSYPYGSQTEGPNRIYWPYMIAGETASSGSNIWILEDDSDYYASRWEVIGTSTYNSLVYDNAFFGTGAQTDDDNGWNAAIDIARDVDNNYFVLDILSGGAPRIKMWSVAGDITTSEGGFGDSTAIESDPLRIEGTDHDVDWFGSYLFVLHGNSTDGWMISIFFDVEEP